VRAQGLTLTLDLGTVFDRANGLLFRVCGVRLILGQYTKLGKVLVEGSAAAAGDGGGGWAPLLQTSVQEATESGRYALRRFPCARARRVRLTLSQAVGDVYIVREVELPGHAGFCQLRCRHGGACLSEGSACACVPRWRWSGANCSDVDECASNNGGCGGGDEARARCTNTDGGFSCACRGGFGGDTKVCDDLDECYSANDCVTAGGSRCENTVGSYSCRCLPGYASAVSEQQVKRGERPSARCAAVCSFGACKNGGKCTAPDSCTGCLGGWSGPRCDQVDVKKQRQAVEDAATYCESPLVWDCSINFVPLVGCGCRARPVIFMVYASALFLALIVAATLLLFWRSCWRGRRARKLLQRVEAMEKEDEEEEAQAMRELQEEEDEEWDEHGFISGAGNATVANAEWMLNGYEEQDLEGRLSTVQFNSKDEEQEDPSDKEARRQRQALAKARKKAKAPKDLESRGAKWKPGSAMPQGKGKKFEETRQGERRAARAAGAGRGGGPLVVRAGAQDEGKRAQGGLHQRILRTALARSHRGGAGDGPDGGRRRGLFFRPDPEPVLSGRGRGRRLPALPRAGRAARGAAWRHPGHLGRADGGRGRLRGGRGGQRDRGCALRYTGARL